MSTETKTALDDAIAAHVESEYAQGGMVCTGYSLIVACSTPEDFDEEITRYLTEYADRQPFHTSLGLVHRHRLILESSACTGDDE